MRVSILSPLSEVPIVTSYPLYRGAEGEHNMNQGGVMCSATTYSLGTEGSVPLIEHLDYLQVFGNFCGDNGIETASAQLAFFCIVQPWTPQYHTVR